MPSRATTSEQHSVPRTVRKPSHRCTFAFRSNGRTRSWSLGAGSSSTAGLPRQRRTPSRLSVASRATSGASASATSTVKESSSAGDCAQAGSCRKKKNGWSTRTPTVSCRPFVLSVLSASPVLPAMPTGTGAVGATVFLVCRSSCAGPAPRHSRCRRCVRDCTRPAAQNRKGVGSTTMEPTYAVTASADAPSGRWVRVSSTEAAGLAPPPSESQVRKAGCTEASLRESWTAKCDSEAARRSSRPACSDTCRPFTSA